MNDCRDQLDGRWNDGRAARWAGVDLLGCDEDAVAIEPVFMPFPITPPPPAESLPLGRQTQSRA